MHPYRSPDSDHLAASKAAKASSSGDDVMDVLVQVEQQLQRLKSARQEQDQSYAARQLEIERQKAALEAEHEDMRDRLEKAEKNVGDLIQQLESTSAELSEKNKELKRSGAELARLHKRINQLEESANQAEEAAASAKKFEQKIASLESDLQQRNKELQESHRKVEQASKKLAEFAKTLSEQTAQLERGAAAIAMVDQQQEQIERLTKQLAEKALASNPEEIRRRDKRIADLTDALRQARGQSGGEQNVAELEQHNAALMEEVDRLKLELQNAQLAAEQAQRQLEGVAEGQTSHIVHEASSAEHSARIAALAAEIERLQSQAAIDLREQLEAQKGKHQQELTAVQRAEAKALQDLRSRIASLEAELQDAREEAAAASSGEGQDQAAYSSALREKAERISTVAEHLRRRRSRLIRVRELLKGKAVVRAAGTPSERMHAEEMIRIENERIQLADLRKALAKSERVMVRRWARSKAIVNVGAIALLLVVCAVISWFSADHLFPAQLSASVMVEARGHQKGEVTDEQLQSWAQWHLELLADPEFHQALAKRMADRRLDLYNTPAKVSQRIRTGLTTDANDKGIIRLTLAGTDRNDITAFLDVLTATMLAESNRMLTKRPDNTAAVVPAERRESGRIRFASVNEVPISDERLRYALPIFGGLFVISLVVIIIAYTHLMRVKRVFDDEHAPLFNDPSTTRLP